MQHEITVADGKTVTEGATGIDVECFSDRISSIDKLKQIMRSGNRILCKASNSVGLNKVVEELT